MSLATIFRFQFGQADAIQQMAGNCNSIIAGVVLVLLTAIARNYDQTFFGGSLFWLIGPLIFSFFSGSFLFLVLYRGFIRRHLTDVEQVSTGQQWLCFMSVFWMTAPIAWLYAVPVERFLGSYQAAQANLSLLAIVSIWRVLLLARIISVLQEVPFIRALGWVLVGACLETLIVGFFGSLFSPAFGRRVMAAMGGMRNSPEEELMLSALGNALAAASIVLFVVLLVLASFRFRQSARAFPSRISQPLPRISLVALAVGWLIIAIPAQLEQQHFRAHAVMIESGKYRESVEFLGRHSRNDFPPARRLEPNPYEHRAFEQLPKVIAALQPTDPEWVRTVYMSHMEVLLSHRYMPGGPLAMTEVMLTLERLPEGREWVARNRNKVIGATHGMTYRFHDGSDAEQIAAAVELTNVLRRLGIDLAQIDAPED